MLEPHLVPAMSSVHQWVGKSMHAGMADYALRAATLSHSEAVMVLAELHDRLPPYHSPVVSNEAPATSCNAGRLVADAAAHDRFFHVRRVYQSEATVFVRGIIMAATLFHTEMGSAYDVRDAQRFVALSAGFAALLGQIGGVRVAPVEHVAPAALAGPASVDPMWRWVLGHQIFAALTQGIIFELQELEAAIRGLDQDRARDALRLAGDLLVASAAAFRFTADFFPSAYTDVVRPRMMAQHVGEGFSGLLSADHRRLVAILVRTRPLMGEIATRFAMEHKRLTVALDHVYDAHKHVCARFVGDKKPSLRCPNNSPMPGVAQLDQYHRGRAELLRSDSGRDTLTPVLNERPLL
jgi:hypothetical protein